MRTIAIVNQKGGVGKTTTTVNLAACLAEKKRSVLVLDLDPQSNATKWCGIKEEDAEEGMLELFTSKISLKSYAINTSIKNVEIVPASNQLITLEKRLAGRMGIDTILHRKIEDTGGDWDYLLMDCPPSLNLLTINALTAARELIVPVLAQIMSLSGFADLLQSVEDAKDIYNKELKITGIVACMVNKRARHTKDVLLELRRNFDGTVYETVIRQNTRLAEAYNFCQPIIQYDAKSIGAEDYRNLTKEVIKQERRLKNETS